MDVDVIQFWNRLAVSNVLDAAVCAKLQSQFESEFASGENHLENLVNWLRERTAISTFQADILQSPDGGRLQFGNYLIVAEPDASGDFFPGLHKLTRHPVQLVFFSGSDQATLARWRSAQALARAVSSATHPNVLRLFEWVAVPDYRFLVTEPPWPMLTEKIPLKSRLPHQAAADIVGQIADGLAHLHELGIAQGETEQSETDQLTESAIRLSNQKTIQLIPSRLDTSRSIDQNTDPKTNRVANESSLAGNHCRRLGQIWYRLLTGRQPQYEGTPETTKPLKEELLRLKKLDTPDDSIRVIQKLLGNTEPEKIPLAALVAHCKKFGYSPRQQHAKRSESLVRYEQWLKRAPGIVAEQVQLVDDAELAGVDFGVQESLQDGDLQAARTAVNQQDATTASSSGKTVRRNSLIPIAGSLLVLACLVGLVAVMAARIPSESFRDTPAGGQVASNENSTTNSSTENRSDPTVGEIVSADSVSLDPNVVLIEDDQESLWESPTNGQPISLKFVPPAAKIILHIRLADLSTDEAGQLLLQSFGPAINSELERVEQRLGVPREQIESLLISFHSNDELEYETFTLASLSQPKSVDEMLEILNNPIAKTDENKNAYFQLDSGDHLFLVAAENQATAIALASQPLIEESLANYDTDVSRGAIKNLAQLSDSERHLSIVTLRPGLFNDEGQKLMGAGLADLNRELSLAFDERIRGIGASLHLDHGSFLEFSFDAAADIKNDDLKQLVEGRIASIDSNVSRYLAGLPQHSFWESVRTRVTGMSNDLTQNLRCDIENRQVICNGWFAPAAAHNWFAAGELLLSFANPSQAGSASDKPQKTIPQTIDELLQTPRDLAVSTSPDLILLIENLQQEILDEYGALPFEFEIRLMGADLSKEGITQNQRPNDFSMKQRSLADILAEIMVQANPDKNITGADDPNCKMVWVVANDPADSNRRIILITTRKAANEKSYRLPDAFIPK